MARARSASIFVQWDLKRFAPSIACLQANADFDVDCISTHCTGTGSCDIPPSSSIADLKNWAEKAQDLIPATARYWTHLTEVGGWLQHSCSQNCILAGLRLALQTALLASSGILWCGKDGKWASILAWKQHGNLCELANTGIASVSPCISKPTSLLPSLPGAAGSLCSRRRVRCTSLCCPPCPGAGQHAAAPCAARAATTSRAPGGALQHVGCRLPGPGCGSWDCQHE